MAHSISTPIGCCTAASLHPQVNNTDRLLQGGFIKGESAKSCSPQTGAREGYRTEQALAGQEVFGNHHRQHLLQREIAS
ncbi:hypothetical protein ACP70R_030182 [Stipagrostis hirtigluma subsp. patula]